MATLKNELPRSGNARFVFYDFETIQDTKVAELASLHVPNLVSLKSFVHNVICCPTEEDCERFGKRKHSSWDDPI